MKDLSKRKKKKRYLDKRSSNSKKTVQDYGRVWVEAIAETFDVIGIS